MRMQNAKGRHQSCQGTFDITGVLHHTRLVTAEFSWSRIAVEMTPSQTVLWIEEANL